MGVGRSVAVGPVLRRQSRLPAPPDTPFTGDPNKEWLRASEALSATSSDLMDRADRVDGQARGILQALADQASDTALLDLTVVLALVTEQGGPTSHTAILARSKSLPAVVGASEAASLQDGMI